MKVRKVDEISLYQKEDLKNVFFESPIYFLIKSIMKRTIQKNLRDGHETLPNQILIELENETLRKLDELFATTSTSVGKLCGKFALIKRKDEVLNAPTKEVNLM